MNKFFTTTYFFCIGILVSTSCQKVDIDGLTNLNNNRITVLGHRGSGITGIDNTYPGNSLESMEVGIDELGADGLEMDIQLSMDSQLMLYHDIELSKLTSCNGMINSHTKENLEGCIFDAAFFNAPFKDYHLVSLEKVFNRFKNYSPKPVYFLDTKHNYDAKNYTGINDFNLDFAENLNDLIIKYNLEEYALISSGNKEMLQILKSNYPSLKLIMHGSSFEDALQDARSMNLFGITIHYKNISREEVETAHANNLRVTLWGVRTKASCREAVKLFPDYIKTDNILYLLSLIR